MTDQRATSLRWLANQFPAVETPRDDTDRMQTCIHLYCAAGADAIETLTAQLSARQAENAEKDKEIEKLRMQVRVKEVCISGKSSIIARVETERDALLEYANAQMECETCKHDVFCPLANPTPENCALCELKPKCPCHPCKWEWRGVQGGGVRGGKADQ